VFAAMPVCFSSSNGPLPINFVSRISPLKNQRAICNARQSDQPRGSRRLRPNPLPHLPPINIAYQKEIFD
jgi:hypothetical protein